MSNYPSPRVCERVLGDVAAGCCRKHPLPCVGRWEGRGDVVAEHCRKHPHMCLRAAGGFGAGVSHTPSAGVCERDGVAWHGAR